MKQPREDRAAYQASQSLFDALRTATARLDRQKAHLAISRDLVQRLHVKLRNDDDEPETRKHKRYVDCAVKAWQDATESFTEILQELAAIVGPDPTEGREARPEYGALLSMFETARGAKEAASDYSVSENVANVLKSEMGIRTASKRPPEAPSSAQRMQIAGQKRSSPADLLELDVGDAQKSQKLPRLSEQNPSTALNGHNAIDSATEALRSHRAKSSVERDAPSEVFTKQQNGQTLSKDSPGDIRPSPAAQAPDVDVQYEDVSAELEARLKAKEERKKVTKAEKKRKRESINSLSEGHSLHYGHEYAKMEKQYRGEDEGTKAIDLKPPKKKQRQKNRIDPGEAVAAKDSVQSKNEKRKQGDEEGGESKAGRKKRRM